MEMITGINFFKNHVDGQQPLPKTPSPFPKILSNHLNQGANTSPLQMYQNYLLHNNKQFLGQPGIRLKATTPNIK
jgi:hypothetical protein